MLEARCTSSGLDFIPSYHAVVHCNKTNVNGGAHKKKIHEGLGRKRHDIFEFSLPNISFPMTN